VLSAAIGRMRVRAGGSVKRSYEEAQKPAAKRTGRRALFPHSLAPRVVLYLTA